MNVTLFLVYLGLYLFIVWYWMTFFNSLTFKSSLETILTLAITLYFISMGYEIFYSAFILDDYYKANNSDELDEKLMRIWLATLSIEAITLVAFTIRKFFASGVMNLLFKLVLALHAIVVGFLPIGAIVYLIESIELVDEEDKMLALVAAYIIAIVGVVGSLPWAYNIMSE